MAGIAHLATGFALKWAAPKAPLWALLVGAEAMDLLCIPLLYAKVPDLLVMGLTHGLFMNLVWSALSAALVYGIGIARKKPDMRSALVIGFSVFSHWILDFITHPMGALMGEKMSKPDLPVFFAPQPLLGLGLYNHSYAGALVFEFGLTFVGVMAYVFFKLREKRLKKIACES